MPAALAKRGAGEPRDDDAGAVVELLLARLAARDQLLRSSSARRSARTVSSEVFFAVSVMVAKSLNGS